MIAESWPTGISVKAKYDNRHLHYLHIPRSQYIYKEKKNEMEKERGQNLAYISNLIGRKKQ